MRSMTSPPGTATLNIFAAEVMFSALVRQVGRFRTRFVSATRQRQLRLPLLGTQ